MRERRIYATVTSVEMEKVFEGYPWTVVDEDEDKATMIAGYDGQDKPRFFSRASSRWMEMDPADGTHIGLWSIAAERLLSLCYDPDRLRSDE